MWSNYVHFNLLKQRRETHTEDFMELFASVISPVEESTFEERVSVYKKVKM